MKISKFLPLVAMALIVGFSACEEKEDPIATDDGMYLLGDATVSTTPDVRLLMAAGINEATEHKDKRDGMYEKYIALEANKDFYFVLHTEGVGDVKYGSSDFAAAKLPTDGDSISGFTGVVSENGKAMRVSESGLYHVVLDLDEDASVGKKLVIVAPAAFGLRGAMNGWGYTAYTPGTFNKEKIDFTSPEDVTIFKGYEFKFAYFNVWKIVLDPGREQVKAEVSLGEGLVTGADNIKFDKESGLYKTVLTWNLAGGSNDKSFKVDYTKNGAPVLPNFGIAGSFNEWKAEGTKVDAVSVSGETYKWTVGPVTLAVGDEFKITDGGTWLGAGDAEWKGAYTANFTGGDNVQVVTAGSYTFELQIDYVTTSKTITVTKH